MNGTRFGPSLLLRSNCSSSSAHSHRTSGSVTATRTESRAARNPSLSPLFQGLPSRTDSNERRKSERPGMSLDWLTASWRGDASTVDAMRALCRAAANTHAQSALVHFCIISRAGLPSREAAALTPSLFIFVSASTSDIAEKRVTAENTTHARSTCLGDPCRRFRVKQLCREAPGQGRQRLPEVWFETRYDEQSFGSNWSRGRNRTTASLTRAHLT